MRPILAGLALALLLAAPVSAGRQTYTIALDGVADGVATVTVTRTLADNDPVAWLAVRCEDGAASDAPVIWGLSTSLVGKASGAVSGACVLRVTVTPWAKAKPNEPSITLKD